MRNDFIKLVTLQTCWMHLLFVLVVFQIILCPIEMVALIGGLANVSLKKVKQKTLVCDPSPPVVNTNAGLSFLSDPVQV